MKLRMMKLTNIELFSAACKSGSLKPVNCWVRGRKKSGSTSLRGSVILKSGKTPTISNAAEYCGNSVPKCFPIGSSLGKKCFANA